MQTSKQTSRSGAAASGKIDRLAADFHTFVGDVEQLLNSASLLPGESLSTARAKLGERVAQAKTRLAEAGAAVADTASRARDAGETYLRARPWTMLGVALAAGALAATLLLRRR